MTASVYISPTVYRCSLFSISSPILAILSVSTFLPTPPRPRLGFACVIPGVHGRRWRDTAGGGAASSWFLCAFFLLQCCAFCVWHNVCLLCAFFLLQCWANMQDIQWSSPSLTFSSTPVEVFSAPIAFPAVTAAVPPKAVCR